MTACDDRAGDDFGHHANSDRDLVRCRGTDMKPLRLPNPATLAGLSLYAAFLIALVAAFAWYRLPSANELPLSADMADRETRYVGTITVPREVGEGCRQMKFDNRSGTVQEVGVVPCANEARGAYQGGDRMEAIRKAFSTR
jgi:hypothetical protein